MQTKQNELPLTLTVPEISKILRVNMTAAYALAKAKGFPSLKIGKRIIVPRDAFLDWLEREAWKNV